MERLIRYVGNVAAVHIIACEGMSDMRKMYPYLVRSARFKLDADERVFLISVNDGVVRNSVLTVGTDFSRYHRAVTPAYRSVYLSAARKLSADYGEIRLFYRPRKLRRRKRILRHGAKPRCVLVEPIYRAKRHICVLRGKKIAESVIPMPMRWVNGHINRLIVNYHIIIFVYNRCKEVGIFVKRFAALHIDSGNIARMNNIYSPRRFAVERYPSAHLLQLCYKTTGSSACAQELPEIFSVIFFRDGEFDFSFIFRQALPP